MMRGGAMTVTETPRPTADAPVVVRIRDLTIAYGRRQRVVAVDALSLDVKQNEICAVVGPSGCGKSSLLNAIAGLLAPADGTIEIIGTAQRGAINQSLGYVFQSDGLLPWLTVEANIGLGLRFRKVSKSEIRTKTDEMLELIGLADFRGHRPSQLSGGMRRRVQLAQMIVSRPALLLLDEPFSSLDEPTRVELHQDLLTLCEHIDQTAVLVTHDIGEAVTLADRVLVLSGRPARLAAEFAISVPRPRNVAAVRTSDEWLQLYREIWAALYSEIKRRR